VMEFDFPSVIKGRLALVPSDVGELESRSGAGVEAVRTRDGRVAYLKTTGARLGHEALVMARRELQFYRELAPHVPVATPELLDWVDTGDGVALLLEAVGEPQPVTAWTQPMWAWLGRDLAALHAMPVPAETRWARTDPLQRALTQPVSEEVDAFWGASLPRYRQVTAGARDLLAAINALPRVFVHGDCHTDNLVPRHDYISFCDWPMAGIGRPTTDLAHLRVRAAPSGAMVPPALLDEYLRARPGMQGILERALVAEELAVFVFLWPPFAMFNDSAGIARVRTRTSHLADQWFAGRRT